MGYKTFKQLYEIFENLIKKPNKDDFFSKMYDFRIFTKYMLTVYGNY